MQKIKAIDSTYKLVWSDEFDKPEINKANWEHQVFPGVASGNNELQHYTDRKDNSFIRDGKLVIKAIKENYKKHAFTSARLLTKGKFDFLYGKVEAKICIPSGQGCWPAFWMMPTKSEYGNWPLSGEIDIMESVNIAEAVHGTLHYGAPDHIYTGEGYEVVQDGKKLNFSEDFHVFGIVWQPEEISWYIDGKLISTQTAWKTSSAPYPAPFDKHFHLIFNLAVGGTWPGPPNDETKFPKELEMDWVRVYQTTNKSPKLKITSPENDQTIKNGEPFSFAVDTSDPDGSVDQVKFYHDEKLLGTTNKSPFELKNIKLPDGCHEIKAIAYDNHGFKAQSKVSIKVGIGCPQLPFHGDPNKIPGKLQAEDFDLGQAGEAYHDSNKINSGKAYRKKSGVDIAPNGSSGHHIGWTEAGEWLEYSVDVTRDGTFNITSKAASGADGGRFHFEIDGKKITEEIKVPATGDWGNYINIISNEFKLTAGSHKLRMVIDSGGINLDFFEFKYE